MKTTTTTITTRDRREIGAYVWDRYEDGTLDVYWANDGEHALAIYGRWVIDPTTKTVTRYADQSTAEEAAAMGSGPGSEDYYIFADVIDRDTGETGYKAVRDGGHGETVGTSPDWETLAETVNNDMDDQGVYGNVFLEDRYFPEMVTFVGLPDGPLTFARADVTVPNGRWTV